MAALLFIPFLTFFFTSSLQVEFDDLPSEHQVFFNDLQHPPNYQLDFLQFVFTNFVHKDQRVTCTDQLLSIDNVKKKKKDWTEFILQQKEKMFQELIDLLQLDRNDREFIQSAKNSPQQYFLTYKTYSVLKK